jgi:hypothetical protein
MKKKKEKEVPQICIDAFNGYVKRCEQFDLEQKRNNLLELPHPKKT